MRPQLTTARLALVTSSLAFAVAIGGTGYAATKLPAKSVGTTQLKTNAVTSTKVKDRSLKAVDFAPGQVPRGATGPIGPSGQAGPAGPAGPFVGTLPSGKTLRGVFALSNNNNAVAEGGVSWGLALETSPVVQVVQEGEASTANCPGTVDAPSAAPGKACFYVNFSANVGGSGLVTYGPGNLALTDFRFGAAIYYSPTAAGISEIAGTWAVTAP